MSTHEEIQAEFERDINRKTAIVVSRKGIGALLEGSSGMHVESLFGTVTGDGSAVRDFKTTRENE
jgi:hypothetical protein